MLRFDPESDHVHQTLGEIHLLRGGRPRVPAGALVVLHGLLPHYSAPNRSERSRYAYTLHAIDRGAHYPEDNWLQRAPELPRRGFE